MKIELLTIVSIALATVSCTSSHTIEVSNSSDLARKGEIVELPLSDLHRAVGSGEFVIADTAGNEMPYQITHDSLLIFPVDVDANSTVRYIVSPGRPAPVDTVACGAFYERRKDDFAWENDRAAYRAYGPALEASGERSFGYDVWTKSVDFPVVAGRYRDAFNNISNFHEDNGDGMDVYSVGPTLGAGTAALLDSAGEIIYPRSFESYEILDNGPLRFSVRLVYPEKCIAGDTVRETRVITLDKGEFLNRTVLRYDGLASSSALAPGIVIHRHNPDGFILDNERSVMACADLTDNPQGHNGVIYLGVVAPAADSLVSLTMATPEGDAVGHILAKSTYVPGAQYVYYWGSGWSKGFMPDWESWIDYLTAFRARIDSPLTVKVE